MSENDRLAVVGGLLGLAVALIDRGDITILDGEGNDVTEQMRPAMVIRHQPPNPEPDRFMMPLAPRHEPLPFLERFAPHNKGKRRARRS